MRLKRKKGKKKRTTTSVIVVGALVIPRGHISDDTPTQSGDQRVVTARQRDGYGDGAATAAAAAAAATVQRQCLTARLWLPDGG